MEQTLLDVVEGSVPDVEAVVGYSKFHLTFSLKM